MRIKKFLTIFILIFTSFIAQAQTNIFLDRSYWKAKPDVSTVKLAIENGNNPAELNANAFDATVYAIVEQAPDETVKFLLSKNGNDVNKITHDGRTYLFWAAYKGNTLLMEHLLSKGAKTNLLDDHGYTVANFAAANGQSNTKVYDICLRFGADFKRDLDHNGANALLLAAPYDKDFKLSDYFIAKGLDFKNTDSDGNTFFNYAAKAGDIGQLKSIVKKGVSFNDNAMIMASNGMRGSSNSLEVYQYLESIGIRANAISKSGDNALHAIVRKQNQMEIISYFLSKGVDVNHANDEGETVLIAAAGSNKDLPTMELLVGKTKNINQTTKKGVSALALAVKSNTPEVVKLLIDSGANFNLSDANDDNIASYLLASYNFQKNESFESKLKLLQQKGFNISATPKNGNTIYHFAVAKGDINLVKYAQSLKIDINAKNSEGFTALQKSAMTAKDDVILKELVAFGAKKQQTTDFNETAFDLASENEYLNKNNISIDFLK